jgi:nitroreductase
MTKRADTDHPVHDLIATRWSPYAFADRAVSQDDLRALFEAVRWAPSSYNEQPWSYFVATRDQPEEFDRLLSCLVEGNQAWAQFAPVLALGCTRLNFTRNGQPNAAAVHDLGLASANLVLEATARGLSVHQMIGILPDRARELYQIPQDVRPLTGLAIGYAGDPGRLPEKLRDRDLARRPRKPLTTFVFGGTWGTAAPAVRQQTS